MSDQEAQPAIDAGIIEASADCGPREFGHYIERNDRGKWVPLIYGELTEDQALDFHLRHGHDGGVFRNSRVVRREVTPWEIRNPAAETVGNFEPLKAVTLYQACCTNCGYVQEDYGDFSCMDDDAVLDAVRSAGWFERTYREASPTPEIPNRTICHTIELLCTDCQKCDVCDDPRAYQQPDDEEHLVCEAHESHDFSAAVPTT